MKCNQCGKENDPEASFCEHCGASLQNPACPKCGKEYDPDSQFCEQCGRALGQPVAAPIPEPAPTPSLPSTAPALTITPPPTPDSPSSAIPAPDAPTRRKIPAWGWGLIGLAGLGLLLLIAFLVFPQSVRDLLFAPVDTPSSAAANTATWTNQPSSNRTSTRTPTEISYPLPGLLDLVFVNPRISTWETFDDWTGEDWTVSEDAGLTNDDNNCLRLPGEIPFQSWAIAPAIEPGQGILLKFKLSGMQAEFFIAQNQWDTPDYRRFGGALYGANIMETSIWKGSDGHLSNQDMQGSLVFAPEHWYGLFIGVDREQMFNFLVWDWEDPVQFTWHEFRGDSSWDLGQWNFFIQVIEGPIFLDDFSILSFDSFVNP